MPTIEILAIALLAAFAVGGMVARPWRLAEWIWPCLSATVLVATGLLPIGDAARAALGGWDVYLFIGGMMLVSELARREGLFDWLAALAVERARGSPARLFAIVYGVGALVTVFMSNDATAVVLTPAVAAAAKRARTDPLPLLFACAMVANAASFALPISNPANLVVFAGAPPSLGAWLARFGLSALAATLATFVALRFAFRRELAGEVGAVARPRLSRTGMVAFWSVAGSALALLGASALGAPLGAAAAVASLAGLAAVCAIKRESPRAALHGVSWTSLLLVAGLFVVVRALEHTGLVQVLAGWARSGQGRAFAAAGGAVTALASNALNNLPAGMLAAATMSSAHATPQLRAAVAVGIDLGPNLTLVGSLSSVLWLLAARREGVAVGGWQFARIGAIATPPALLLAFALLR